MIRINLLPYRAARRKENIRRQTSVFFLSFIFVGILFYYYQLQLDTQITHLGEKTEALNIQLKALRKSAKEVDESKKELENLKIKLDSINAVKNRRTETVRLLETMTQVLVPNRMWLTEISVNDSKVGIIGKSLDQKSVADFMTQLESTDLFSSVNLKTLQHETLEELKGKLKSALQGDEELVKKFLEKWGLANFRGEFGLKNFEINCDRNRVNNIPIQENQ